MQVTPELVLAIANGKTPDQQIRQRFTLAWRKGTRARRIGLWGAVLMARGLTLWKDHTLLA